MTDLLNHELDLYTVAAATELFVLFAAACVFCYCYYICRADKNEKI